MSAKGEDLSAEEDRHLAEPFRTALESDGRKVEAGGLSRQALNTYQN